MSEFALQRIQSKMGPVRKSVLKQITFSWVVGTEREKCKQRVFMTPGINLSEDPEDLKTQLWYSANLPCLIWGLIQSLLNELTVIGELFPFISDCRLHLFICLQQKCMDKPYQAVIIIAIIYWALTLCQALYVYCLIYFLSWSYDADTIVILIL